METINGIEADYQRAAAITTRVLSIKLEESKDKKAPSHIGRRLVVAVLKFTGHRVKEIARLVGYSEHSTVCYQVKKHLFAANNQDEASLVYNLAFSVVWKEFTLGIEFAALTMEELAVLFYSGEANREKIINPDMPVKNYEFVKRNDLNAALATVAHCTGVDILTYKARYKHDKLAYTSMRLGVMLLRKQAYGLSAIAIALNIKRSRVYEVYNRHLTAIKRKGEAWDEYRALVAKASDRFQMIKDLNLFASEECDVPVGPSPYVFVGLPKKSAS